MPDSSPATINSPSPWRRRCKYVALAIAVALLVDYCWFAFTRDRLIGRASNLGGYPYSLGGWPFGQQHVVRFDEPVSDEALRQLFEALPTSRRSLCVYFTCELSEERVKEIRGLAPERCSIIVDERTR
jgi:hypothetical protein